MRELHELYGMSIRCSTFYASEMNTNSYVRHAFLFSINFCVTCFCVLEPNLPANNVNWHNRGTCWQRA